MKPKYLKPLVFVACLLPLARLGWKAFNSALGANPIQIITWSTGTFTLVFLMITLAITPVRRLTGQYWLIQFRRMFGLFAFFYGCLHFTTYIWLDQFFDWHSMVKDVYKRPFITVGFTAFVLLIPLALTSTQRSIRWLGKRWVTLHRLIYFTAIFGVIHYIWLVKADLRKPLIYATILSVLLIYRALARAITRLAPGLPSNGRSRTIENRSAVGD